MTDPAKKERKAELHALDVATKQEELALKQLETKKRGAEARKAEAEAIAYEMDLVAKKELRATIEASDKFHHTYYFNDRVDAGSVDTCIDTLTRWSRLDPGCDLHIYMNSPGGSVLAGVALYDFLMSLRTAGHRLTITAQGIAASMAGVLLQAGDVRRMGRESWLLIHEGSIGAQGSFADVADTVEWFKKVQERFLDIFASRSNLTKATIKKNWSRKDWWLSSDECLKHGLVDEVL